MNQARIEHAFAPKPTGGDQALWRFLSRGTSTRRHPRPASPATMTRPVTTTPAALRPAATLTPDRNLSRRPASHGDAERRIRFRQSAPLVLHPRRRPYAPRSRPMPSVWRQGALCIEPDETRQGEPTLRIEAARATAPPRKYDWRQKLAATDPRGTAGDRRDRAGIPTHCE